MIASATVVLSLAGVIFGTDDDKAQVIGRIKEYCDQIRSIRVQGVDRIVKSGGLWAKTPAAERPVYDLKAKSFEYDIWVDPPKQRLIWTEKRGDGNVLPSSSQQFYDGQTYTYLSPSTRSGLTVKGASYVTPLKRGPLHAIGYCFLDTYHCSLASLLTDPAKVTVTRLAVTDKGTKWLVELKSLPDDIRPRDWSEKGRRQTLVRMWLTINEYVRIDRWAVYSPRSGKPESDAIYGRPIPNLQLDGYNLFYGFVNCDFRPVRDEQGDRDVLGPGRVLHGNGNATYETRIQDLVINPRTSSHAFRPAIPAGYSITRPTDNGDSRVEVSGGLEGTAVRVREISQQAREVLGSGESLRAQPSSISVWVVVSGCAALMGGVALGFLLWRKRT